MAGHILSFRPAGNVMACYLGHLQWYHVSLWNASALSCLSPKPNGPLFAVLALEGHSHAVVPQALRTGSPELPAFVSTPVGRVSMLAFVCSDVQTSSPVTISPSQLSLPLFLSVWYFSWWTWRPTHPAAGALAFLHTPFCPPCSLSSCSYPCLLIQRSAGSSAGGRGAPTGSAGACGAVWSQGLRLCSCVLALPVSPSA